MPLIDAACFICLAGSSANQRFPIPAAGLRVGRVPQQNQLVLDDAEISRLHARLVLEASGEARLIDSSANGTFVNGRRVGEAVLRPGDQVRFGSKTENTFQFEAPLAAAARAAAGPARGTIVASTGTPRRMGTLVMSEHEEEAPRRRLQLILDQYAVRDIPLEGARLEVGRTEGAGKLFIDHTSISSIHAEFLLAKEGAVLRDLGSTNGTFVNGERIGERVLQDGDLIQFGACDSHMFLYRESRRRATVLRDVELNRPVVTLGRDPGNDIHINHPTVSARHAEVRKVNGAFELVDLQSTNGTFVNGHRIRRQMLQAHDRISLGAVQFVFDGSQMEQQSDGTRVRLTARSISVEARDFHTGAPVRLLDDVWLVIEPCEFVGLLGPSGAGKSTLMDALNGSRPAQHGSVRLNSSDLYAHFDSLRALIGYLPQEDILHRQLTVRECLYYSARLRLPDDFGEKETWERVNEVIGVLELAERADTTIAQLSGGQRKRLSLGIELLSKPALLFVDEPTAGQDPRTEMKMMQLFREVANRGSTVIINTHLLGSFSLLDKVAVLVRGKMAYFGGSQEMLPYFNACRPQEIYDKLQEKKPEEWAAHYRQSETFHDCIGSAIADHDTANRLPSATPAAKSRRHSLWRQLLTLLGRQFTLKFKDKATIIALLLPPAVVAVLMAVMKRGVNDPKVLFMMVVVSLWFGCSSTVREIVDELPVYRRERQGDLTLTAYLGCKLVYLATVASVQTLLFMVVLMAMGAVENHALEASLLIWLLTIEGGLIGLLISSIFSSAEKALYAFPLSMIPQLLLAGMLIPVTTLHPYYPVLTPDNRVQVQQLPEALSPTGMGPVLKYGLSPLMISRWGLEALTDLYIHDNKEYSYPLLNAVAITFHPDDAGRARARLLNIQAQGLAASGDMDTGSSAFLPYLAIFGAFAVLLIGATATALWRRENHRA